MKDTRPYVYAHEQDGEWSLVLHSYIEDNEDKTEILVKGISREQAIQVVKKQREIRITKNVK